MIERRPNRPVSTTQIMGIMASTLALFFMVAFATKAIDAYRLARWRERIKAEITDLEHEKRALELEIEYRQSEAWLHEVLRDAGMVRDDTVRVLPITVTPQPTPLTTATPAPALVPPPVREPVAFSNANWEAWQRLIWGFD